MRIIILIAVLFIGLLEAQQCAQGLLPCGGACYSAGSYDCIGGVLCPAGLLRCADGCYNTTDYDCLTKSDGTQLLCAPGSQLCSDNCCPLTLTQQRANVVRSVYQNLIFPGPFEILLSGGASQDAFDPSVTGRVNAVGQFDGFTDSIEYFYALALQPATPQLIPGVSIYVYDIDITLLDVVGTRASIMINIWFQTYLVPNSTFYLTEIGWFVFTPNTAKILHYDLTILRMDQIFDAMSLPHANSIYELCTGVQQLCVGPNQQYSNFTACVEFMSGIDFGSWSNVWSNTVVCRTVHSILAGVSPDVHCPHVGPTGGMKCVYHSYFEWLEYTYVTNPGVDTI